MTKKKLVRNIADASGLPAGAVHFVIGELVGEIRAAVRRGDRVTFRGLGTFRARPRAGRWFTDLEGNVRDKAPGWRAGFTPSPAFRKVCR